MLQTQMQFLLQDVDHDDWEQSNIEARYLTLSHILM